MEFCNFCDNMLYIKDEETDKFKVKQYCKNCNFEKPLSEIESSKVINSSSNKTQFNYTSIMTKHIEYDPTIPHIDNIKCPNDKCTKAKDKNNDIMYIKTNEIYLKFVYYCTYCKFFWENNLTE